jgi:hypothetical protein
VTNRVVIGPTIDAFVPLRIQGCEMLAKWGVSKGVEGEGKSKSIQLELTPSEKDQPDQAWMAWKMFNNMKDFDDWFLKTAKEKRNEWWPAATKEDEYDDRDVQRAVQRLCVPKISSNDTTKMFPPCISLKIETDRKDATENTKFFRLKDPTKKGKDRFAPENIEAAEWTDINPNARIVPVFEFNHFWLGPIGNRKVTASWKMIEAVIVTGGKKKDDGLCHAQEDDTPIFGQQPPAPVQQQTVVQQPPVQQQVEKEPVMSRKRKHDDDDEPPASRGKKAKA